MPRSPPRRGAPRPSHTRARRCRSFATRTPPTRPPAAARAAAGARSTPRSDLVAGTIPSACVRAGATRIRWCPRRKRRARRPPRLRDSPRGAAARPLRAHILVMVGVIRTRRGTTRAAPFGRRPKPPTPFWVMARSGCACRGPGTTAAYIGPHRPKLRRTAQRRGGADQGLVLSSAPAAMTLRTAQVWGVDVRTPGPALRQLLLLRRLGRERRLLRML